MSNSRIIGPYQLLERLGDGGFGEVWRAIDTETEDVCAVKIAKGTLSDLDDFLYETQTWSVAGGHPNVHALERSRKFSKRLLLISQFAPNGSLRNWISDQEANRAPSVEAAIRMTCGILSGLEHLHTRTPPLLHRDLKPENVLLFDETPRIADFGLTRILNRGRTHVKLSKQAGTWEYSAPEVYKDTYRIESDIWSVGVMLYEMLSGHLPFLQRERAALMAAVLQEPPYKMSPDIPEPIQSVVLKSLEKEPKDRFDSAKAMQEALDDAVRTLHMSGICDTFASADRNSSSDRPFIERSHRSQSVKRRASKVSEQIRSLTGHADAVGSVCYSPDGQHIITGSEDRTVKIWDAASGTEIRSLNGHSGAVWSVCYSPDGQHIITGSDDKTVKIWDAATGKEVETILGHSGAVRSVSYSPDGHHIITGSDDKTVQLWDAATGQKAKIWDAATIWEAAARRKANTLKGHSDAITSVCYARDGTFIITGSKDDTATIWDAASGKEIRTLIGHSDEVWAVCCSHDGKYLVTGSKDKTAKIWDALTGRLIKTLRGHAYAVWSVCYSPDDKYIVTGSDDRTARLWTSTTGNESQVFVGHTNNVLCVCYSPNSNHIVTGSQDRTAKIWHIEGEIMPVA